MRCDSIHWYDGDECVLPRGHVGLHDGGTGLTWLDSESASSDSVYCRMRKPTPAAPEESGGASDTRQLHDLCREDRGCHVGTNECQTGHVYGTCRR